MALLLGLEHLALVAQLEPVAERPHVRVLALHHLEGVWYNTHHPGVDARCTRCLEAEIEVARVLGIDAERVRRPVGIGVDVRSEPFLWKT